MEHHKIVEPRAPTPAPGAGMSYITGRLPDDLLSEHVDRLALFSAIGAGLWAFSLFMHIVVHPLTTGKTISSIEARIEVLGIVFSLGVFLYVRFARHCLQTKTEIGLVFMVLNAILIAMLNTWAVTPSIAQLTDRLSWTTIVILITAMIVPATPRKMLAASLVAASMDPLGVWVAHLRGVAVPSAAATLVVFMPNYICAVVAVLPSHVLQRIGRRLNEAQAMGSYHLVEMLGRGGMGEVYRASHRMLARPAAIKLIRPEMLGGDDPRARTRAIARFRREAEAAARLQSAHTVDLYDFGLTADQTLYLVMELLDGMDLESLVRQHGPQPAPRVIHILRQVCDSLEEAHARGLVHRDIKPANIHIGRVGCREDFVKVLDFGLVKTASIGAEPSLATMEGVIVGTPAYMAPEMALGEDVDARADLYALGCVAYYLLTGVQVFTGDTPIKVITQHLQAVPMPPSARTELRIPVALDQLVLACLAKSPEDRPQSARELARSLDVIDGMTWSEDEARLWWSLHHPLQPPASAAITI